MSFGVNLLHRDGDVHVEMQGALDEEATLPSFTQPPRQLTLDLGGVNLINSMGCRRWMTWIGEIARTTPRIRLERCSHAVLQQINVLGGFLPARAEVASLFVPYECPRCGHGARVLHRCDEGFRVESVPEHLTCAACGGEMVLEIVRPTYFKFLGSRSA